ncbi:MAG: sirohydrochlorin cobaltochelatase [Bilophila wadsworthia]
MKKCFVMVLLCCLLVAGTAFAKTGTLLVAFGTSMDSARPAIDDIEKAYKKAAGNEPVLLAFTSDIIRNKLAKEGKPVLSVNAAMNELAAQGVTDLKIQSLHIAPAEEYNQLERMVVKNITKNPGVFKTVKVGYPLLVSEKDLDAVVKVVLASLPKDRKPGDAVVLMGHGNDRGPGDLTLAATAAAFHKADPHVWLATVKAPTASTTSCPSSRLPAPSASGSSPS